MRTFETYNYMYIYIYRRFLWCVVTIYIYIYIYIFIHICSHFNVSNKMKRSSEFHCPACSGAISVTRVSLSMYLQHAIYLYVHTPTIALELIHIFRRVKISQDVYIYIWCVWRHMTLIKLYIICLSCKFNPKYVYTNMIYIYIHLHLDLI